MNCVVSEDLRLALRAAMIEVNLRIKARRDYLRRQDCEWDGESIAFLEQAVVEADLRSTEARKALEAHTEACAFCCSGKN